MAKVRLNLRFREDLHEWAAAEVARRRANGQPAMTLTGLMEEAVERLKGVGQASRQANGHRSPPAVRPDVSARASSVVVVPAEPLVGVGKLAGRPLVAIPKASKGGKR